MLEAASAGDQQAMLDSEELQLFRQVSVSLQDFPMLCTVTQPQTPGPDRFCGPTLPEHTNIAHGGQSSGAGSHVLPQGPHILGLK